MVLTALAGLAVGIVGMRLWQERQAATPNADGHASPSPAGPAANRTKLMLAAAGALLVVAVGIFALRPTENQASPLDGAPALAGGGGQQLDDVDTMIERLAARLRDDPSDGEGFRMLGWSYLMTGRPEQAVEPFKRAIELLPDSPQAHSGYGETLVLLADDRVTAEAKAEFDKALALDPTEPRARYFQGVWLEQSGRRQEALDLWIDLANSAGADAPWQADVRSRISATAEELGVDVSGRLKSPAPVAATGARPPALDQATIQAANQLPPGEQQAMIDDMVEGLAAKLRANPDNAEGWGRLITSRMVLGQTDQAQADLAAARSALAGDNAGLAVVESAAVAARVPRD